MSGQVINSYATLEQALQDWLARSDITDTTYAPEIIQMAQLRLYQGYIDNKGEYWPGMRVRQMEKALGAGLVSGVTIGGGGGASYAVTDTISFTAAPTGGVTATGTLTVTNGVITAVNVTNPGLGYTSAPTVTITTSTGSGATLTATISSVAELGPNGNYAVPADYLDLKYMYVTDSGGITYPQERKDPAWIYKWYSQRSAAGIPCYVARDNGIFVFGPFPDSQYSLAATYYYQDTLLSSSYTSNFLTVNYPNILLWATLAEAAAFVQDQQSLQWWEQKLNGALRVLQVVNRNESLSGSSLRMVPG